MLAKDITIIKVHNYTYEPLELGGEDAPAPHCAVSIIKRHQINYSYAEKYKLGFISPQEYAIWQDELYKKAQEEAARALEDKSKEGKTFWENDTGIRKNVSNDDYDKFLKENGLDVSNTTAVDVSAIINDENEKTIKNLGIVSTQGTVDTILSSANAEDAQAEAVAMLSSNTDQSDPNRVLSADEIAALFAAAGA